MNASIWKRFLKVISNMKLGESISRQTLLELLKEDQFNHYYGSKATIDSYRWILVQLGVLETNNPRGLYVKRKNISSEWSLSKLKSIAVNKDWRLWYYKFD